MAKKENGIVYVERELIEKNGKSFYTYFIKGMIRNVNVKIAVTPPDFGGYTVLDIVFEGAKEVKLDVRSFTMKNDKGEETVINTFNVVSLDDNGEVYECPVKAKNKSDKILLSMLTR